MPKGTGRFMPHGSYSKPPLVGRRPRTDAPLQRLYSTARWKRLRRQILRRDPLCVECDKMGVVEPSTQADHVVPHAGDLDLFYDESNLQGLCRTCHSSKTGKELRARDKVDPNQALRDRRR